TDEAPSDTPTDAERQVAPTTVPSSNGHVSDAADVLSTEPESEVGPQARTAPFEVVCFGGPRVLVHGPEVWPALEASLRHRPWEVLVYMAAQPDDVVGRGRLLAALWPDVEPDTAEGRLRDALTHLRRLLAELAPDLPPDLVKSSRDGTCRLDPSI